MLGLYLSEYIVHTYYTLYSAYYYLENNGHVELSWGNKPMSVCIVHNHWSLSNWCCQLLSNVSFPFNHHKQAFAFTTNPAADMDVLEVVELLTKSTQT